MDEGDAWSEGERHTAQRWSESTILPHPRPEPNPMTVIETHRFQNVFRLLRVLQALSIAEERPSSHMEVVEERGFQSRSHLHGDGSKERNMERNVSACTYVGHGSECVNRL